MNIWEEAKKVHLNIAFECSYKFIVETKGDIDREVKRNLLNFMDFIESEYSLKHHSIWRFLIRII